jgi:hypothetical protein
MKKIIAYQLQKDVGIHKSEYVSVGRPKALESQGEWPTSTRIESLVELIREANPQALKDVDDVDISMCQEVDSVVKEFDYDSVIGDIDLSSERKEKKILLVRYKRNAVPEGEMK